MPEGWDILRKLKKRGFGSCLWAEERIISMAAVIFEYKSEATWGRTGMPSGESITVYKDGKVIYREYIMGEKEPVLEVEIAILPKLAMDIQEVLDQHVKEIKQIPSSIDNLSCDGAYDLFRFGRKKISALNIKRNNLAEVDRLNPYYSVMVYENMVLDIFDVIGDILEGYNINPIFEDE